MGLDLWFREDVARILAALASSGDLYGPDYFKALHDVGVAFGVGVQFRQSRPALMEWAHVMPEARYIGEVDAQD